MSAPASAIPAVEGSGVMLLPGVTVALYGANASAAVPTQFPALSAQQPLKSKLPLFVKPSGADGLQVREARPLPNPEPPAGVNLVVTVEPGAISGKSK